MKRILVIEDEQSFCNLVCDKLKKNGYETFRAVTGKNGLEMAINLHPDAILLDIKLPGLDGLSVLRELRKDEWGKSAHVIILTNLDPDEEILRKILTDKPDYYFVKSNISLEELMTRVKGVLN